MRGFYGGDRWRRWRGDGPQHWLRSLCKAKSHHGHSEWRFFLLVLCFDDLGVDAERQTASKSFIVKSWSNSLDSKYSRIALLRPRSRMVCSNFLWILLYPKLCPLCGGWRVVICW